MRTRPLARIDEEAQIQSGKRSVDLQISSLLVDGSAYTTDVITPRFWLQVEPELDTESPDLLVLVPLADDEREATVDEARVGEVLKVLRLVVSVSLVWVSSGRVDVDVPSSSSTLTGWVNC